MESSQGSRHGRRCIALNEDKLRMLLCQNGIQLAEYRRAHLVGRLAGLHDFRITIYPHAKQSNEGVKEISVLGRSDIKGLKQVRSVFERLNDRCELDDFRPRAE